MDLMSKKVLGVRVYEIADDFGLELSKTHEIVSGFLSFCRDQLASGNRVTLLGLVTLIPNPEVESKTKTLAYDCKILADRLGFPQHTVYCIVRAYLDSLIDDVLDGKNADLRGIANIHPIRDDEDNLIAVHSNISSTMSTYLSSKSSFVKGVRVHTHPVLKKRIKVVTSA